MDEGMKRHFTELRRQERGDKKRFYQEGDVLIRVDFRESFIIPDEE